MYDNATRQSLMTWLEENTSIAGLTLFYLLVQKQIQRV